jgi:MFS family permease
MSEASPWTRSFPWRPHELGKTGIIAVLGFTQCLSWGSSYYLLAVLAKPIAAETGWSLTWVVGGVSLGLLIAGFASPAMGRAVERFGGRPVLAWGSVILALGLLGLGVSAHLITYFAAWAILGLGMAVGLYDAAFATLGRLYEAQARRLITNLTLIGGFASTLAWPLSAFFVETWGWRGACVAYAGMHLALGLPMHLLLLPAEARHPGAASRPATAPGDTNSGAGSNPPQSRRRYVLLVWMLGANFTLQAVIATVLSVHLLTILQRLGLELGAAVALAPWSAPHRSAGVYSRSPSADGFIRSGRRSRRASSSSPDSPSSSSCPPWSWRRPWSSTGRGTVLRPSSKGPSPSHSSVRPAMPRSWGASPCRRSSPRPSRRP